MIAVTIRNDYDNGLALWKETSRQDGPLGASMDAELIVVGGKTTRRAFKLKLPMVIGRSRHVRLAIAHPMISRRHSELFERDGLLMVRDLGSLNGTIVAGQRVREAPLPPDAEFSIGPLTFRAHYQYAGDLATLPAAIPDPRREAKPSDSTDDADSAELPDFEALVEADLVEVVHRSENHDKPRDATAPKSATVQTPASTDAPKPATSKPAGATSKPAAATSKPADASPANLEKRLDLSPPGSPAKKPPDDAFDDLLSELD